jgi:dual specificity phosphatase 3
MSTLSINRPRRPEAPELMWRETCWVTNQLAISGDLPRNRTAAVAQLSAWEESGITDVFDMRGEADDSEFIHRNSEIITSHWFGVDDAGTPRSDKWFDEFVAEALSILLDSERKILVHCHMGVNRGPSALYAILLSLGWHHVEALRGIRNVRPIAGIIYAPDAVNWFARRSEFDNVTAQKMENDVRSWLRRNDLDLPYVIRSIGNRLAV